MQFWRLCRRLQFLLLLFGWEALAQQTGVIVSPTDVALAVQAGATRPATASIAITTPNQTVPFSVSVQHIGTTGGWLSASPATGTTPASVTLSADGSRLSAGIYQAQVTVAAGGFGRAVNVVLTVGTGATSGIFGVSPTALTFVAPPGTTVLSPQTISVSSPNGTEGFRVVATSSGWLTVNPLTGTTPGGISVDAFPAGLGPGRHEGAVSIYPLSGGPPTVVPVTLIAGGGNGADRLRLNQTVINFNHQVGTSAPAGQPVSITSAQTNLDFTATVTAPWLRLTSIFNPTPSQSVQGFTPGIISVFVEPSGLAAGTYAATVTITPTNGQVVELPVTLRITASASLNALPSSVVFDETQGTQATVIVTGTGGALPFTAHPTTTSGGDWLRVSPIQSALSSGQETLTITGNTAGLLPATYNGAVVLTAQNGSTVTIPVQMEVTTVSALGTLVLIPDQINMTAVVGDINPVQVLTIGVEGAATHPFSVATNSQGGWLRVDPAGGTAPARVGITASLANVPGPGVHSGIVAVTSLLTGTQYTIPVTLNLLDEVISAEPASMTFTQAKRGTEAPPQTLRITAPLPVRFEVVEKPDWIRLSQAFGSTPADITLWPTVSVTPPGTNSTIRIAGPKNQITIPVAFKEADPAAATVTPESVTLRYSVGQPTLPTQTIEIASGGEPGPFKVAVSTESGGQWLKASPTSGTTPGSTTLSIDPLLLAPGRYTGSVTVTVDNGAVQSRNVPVELMVGSPSAAVQSVLHAAILTPTPVAPGQMISIQGSGLGPLLAVTARPNASGAYDTRLADTRVLFDNTPAPLLYIKNDQINAIVPYSVFGRLSTTMRIEQGSNWSLPLELRVVESNPGVFTANGTGRGQAAVSNSDLTANSVSNPADRGSVVSIFVTGEGQTDPPGNDGRIIMTDIRRPLLPVTVRVGGRPAEVFYAGSAPMQVSGMMQVNFRVPEDISPGVVPVEVQVGTAASQTAVTMAVR